MFALTLVDGQRISARTVVVASGAAYRKPTVPGFERFEGRGTLLLGIDDRSEARQGAGHRADRRRQFGGAGGGLSRQLRAQHPHALIRGRDLNASMSK